jgi:multicomponent Na+:H+ antiporter subunit A
MAVLAAALRFAYVGRFWLGLFAGPRAGRAAPPYRRCSVAPVAVLAAVALAGGFVVAPFAGLAGDAAAVTHGAAVDVSPAYHLDTRAEERHGGGRLGAGARRSCSARASERGSPAPSRAPAIGWGPRRWYGVALRRLNAFSDRSTTPRSATCATASRPVLVPTGVLVALGFAFTPTRARSRSGSVAARTCRSSSCSSCASRRRSRPSATRAGCARCLALSVLGFALAGVYASRARRTSRSSRCWWRRSHARLRRGLLPAAAAAPARARAGARRRRRNVLAGIVAGVRVVRGDLGDAVAHEPRPRRRRAADRAERARRTAATFVTVILADFRGLDTDGGDHRPGGRRHRRGEPPPAWEDV